MGVHEDQFSQHAVHEVLNQLRAAVDQKIEHELSSDAVSHLDKLRQSVSFIASRLESANPVLTSAARLSPLHKALTATLTEVNQFVANGNVAHFANATNQIDTALQQATMIVVMGDLEGRASASESLSFKILAEEVIESLRKKASSVDAQAGEIQKRLTEQLASIESAKQQLGIVQQEASAKLQELTSAFSANENARQEAFKKSAASMEAETKNQLAAILTNSEDIIKDLKTRKAEAEQIVKLVGNIGLTGNFKGAGEEEGKAANLFRWIALGCFSVLVIIVVSTVFIGVANGFNPWVAFFRLTAAAILIVPAAYAARESSRHRQSQRRHRRAELELASIDAYLRSLPSDEQTKIKAALAAKFFGESYGEDEMNAHVDAPSLLKELRHVVDLLAKRP